MIEQQEITETTIKGDMSAEEVVAATADDADIQAMFATKKKKKKTKKAEDDGSEAVDAGASSSAAAESSGGSAAAAAVVSEAAAAVAGRRGALAEGETEETYEDMLSNVYALLTENNPELTSRERKKLKPPQVSRVGTTRTAWTNFSEICSMMKRSPDHVLSFFLAELGTTGSIDGSERLLMRGKFQPKYIESLLRKYISEYVTCAMCRSLESTLTRDPISRLYFMSCKACGSQRSVQPIKAGFHATAKGERKKAREAQG